jgi:hypothetical protein
MFDSIPFYSPIHPYLEQDLNPMLPCKEGYRPSSISHLFHGSTHWILVRYVSYVIIDGRYLLDPLVPYSNISSLNYLVSIEMVDAGIRIMNESGKWLYGSYPTVFSDGMSRGLEDIRMFSLSNESIDSNESNDSNESIRITGTNVDMTDDGIPNCFLARLELLTGRVYDIQVLRSKHVEKNWIPFGYDFLYAWKRNEIVWLNSDVSPNPFPWLYGVRGSSCFVEDGDGFLYAIVHKVHDMKYLHSIVVMDRNKQIIRHSMPFYFRRLGIEYCIGYWIDSNHHHHLFMSNQDRDPVYLQVRKENIVWIEKEDL